MTPSNAMSCSNFLSIMVVAHAFARRYAPPQNAAVLVESLLDEYAARADYLSLLALYRKVRFDFGELDRSGFGALFALTACANRRLRSKIRVIISSVQECDRLRHTHAPGG